MKPKKSFAFLLSSAILWPLKGLAESYQALKGTNPNKFSSNYVVVTDFVVCLFCRMINEKLFAMGGEW